MDINQKRKKKLAITMLCCGGSDMVMSKKIIYWIEKHDNPCEFCKYRKENYRIVPIECTECGFVSMRNQPYISKIPVFEE